jgi:sugar lactone lactonase YvrE
MRKAATVSFVFLLALTALGVVLAGASEPSAATYLRSFGGEGSGAGKLSTPGGVATDAKANVWVADTGHNRIQEFNSKGEFVFQFGGAGQLSEPSGIATDSKGNIWVADWGHDGVKEFNPEGELIRAFGEHGVASGKFDSLQDIAVDPEDHVWTVETVPTKARVQEFNSKGEFIRSFGSVGTENGQFKEPHGIAADSKGNVWVADSNNNRIQEFNSKGEFVRKFGTLGAGNGQFHTPSALNFDAEGNLWVADTANNRVQELTAEGTYLSQFGTGGNNDGQFSEPQGIATGSEGNLLVADTGNDRIQETTASEFVRKFGGEGSGPGHLSAPGNVATDAEGNVWVADTAHSRVQEFNSKGEFIRQFGSKGEANGLFDKPHGIAVDSKGNVWVADSYNHRVQEFNSKGEFIRQFGGHGTGFGKFHEPYGITTDSEGNVWVADTFNNRIQEFNSKGEYLRRFGTKGSENSQFQEPHGIAVDSKGNVWVADTGNDRIKETNYKGEFIAKFGSEGTGNGQLMSPSALAFDSEGKIWVADTANSRLQRFSAAGTYLSQFGTAGTENGQFAKPEGFALDAKGNLWIADTGNDRIQESTPSEFVQAFGDEGSEVGLLSEPVGTATDSEGNVWVADTGHNRAQEFDPEGNFIRKFGSLGAEDGQFKEPLGIAVDPEGNVWVSDHAANRIQEFTAKGEFICKIGSEGYTEGHFKYPWAIAADSAGNVWVADTGNDRVQEFNSKGEFIRKFGSTGAKDGQLKEPKGIAADSAGNVWVADTGNDRVQEFNSKGEFIRKFGSSGTGNGQFEAPSGLTSDSEGNVWVADTGNDRVQRFSAEGTYQGQFGTAGIDGGKFDEPMGIDVSGSERIIWITDTHNNRAQEWLYGSPPSVTTEPAAKVSQHEATLSATINPEGLKTSYQFEYTTVKDFEENGYGSASSVPMAAKEIGSDVKEIKVSEAVAGLEPDTSYQFRVVAKSIAGTGEGEDQTFTTSEWASLSEPSASNTSNYNDIWCLSSANCVAVGGWDASGANQAQVKHWGGTVWAAQEAPLPTGASLSELDGVTCTSSSSCIAVGSYVHEEKETKTLAMTWDGDQWSIITTPNPSGASSSELSEIACSSAEECMAVGKYTDAEETQKTLAMEWDGSSWSIVSTPNASGGSRNELSGVSCRPAYCLAVGSFVNGGEVTKTLAMTWNGEKWSIESTPEPSGAELNQLADVTCLSSTECIAVGTYFNSSGVQKTLILVRLDGSWGIVSSPSPSGALSSQLSAVSCTSSSACTAVGSYKEPSGEVPLTMRWNGTSWLEESVETEGFGAVSLEYSGVSCASSSVCHAVGSITYGHGGVRRNLAFAWNGSKWSLTEASAYTRKWHQAAVSNVGSDLNDVQCFETLGECVAAGTFTDGSGAQRGRISASSDQVTPAPSGAKSSQIAALSCVTAEECIAVGDYQDASTVEWALSLQQTESSWTALEMPVPSGAKSSRLTGTACSSGTDCIAVGSYLDSGDVRTMLTLHWDGTEWSIIGIAPPSGARSSELLAVSCASGSSCAAVGRYVDAEGQPRPLAINWDGAAWTAVKVSLGVEATASHLTGVDCPSTSGCVAIGSYVDSEGAVKPLGVKTSEKKPLEWQGTTVPDLGEGVVAQMSDVSCQNISSCIAVGAATESEKTKPLTLSLNGSEWSDLKLGVPTDLTANGYRLRAVSCVSATECEAVGSVTSSSHDADFAYTFTEEGGKWHVSEHAGGPSTGQLHGVSCVRTTSSTAPSCVAVGTESDPTGSGGMSWMLTDASGWVQVPFGVATDTVNDVDCSSPDACTAIGSGSSEWTIRHWDGSAWSVQSSPAVSGATNVVANGVSCPSATNCTVVGYSENSEKGLRVPLVAAWNGTSWSIVSVPTELSGERIMLSDVSCGSTESCVAVGKTAGTSQAAVERWNGSFWKAESASVPTEATSAELDGVSCSSTTLCTAVGTYTKAGSSEITHGLISRWNGTSWALQSSPSLSKSGSTAIDDVSCYSSSGCVAIARGDHPSMVAWDGIEWTQEETTIGGNTMEPGGAVSCAAATDCIAVGSVSGSGEEIAPLAIVPVEDRAAAGSTTSTEEASPTAPPSLTPTQKGQVDEILEEDPALQAKIGNANYSVAAYPWSESVEGKEVLIGAAVEITLKEPETWSSYQTWPIVLFDSPIEPDPYKEGVMKVSGTDVQSLQANVATLMDESDNFVEGEVVQLAPSEVEGGTVEYKPVELNYNPEFMGY